MSIRIDLHMHTRRHSLCSRIDPAQLIRQAARAGLDAIVITEHHYQWPQDEIDALVQESDVPGLFVMAGFEYTSSNGDILIYGLEPGQTALFKPGRPPEEAAALAVELGGACIAAHPTRAGMSFDDRLFSLPLAAIEVCSVNLKPHERQLALKVAQTAGVPPIASSDAHVIEDVGRYFSEFEDPVRSISELRDCLIHGRFRLTDGIMSSK